MAAGVDVLLDKVDEAVAEIRGIYEQDLAAQEVSDDLLYQVHRALVDMQTILDRTATTVSQKCLGKKRRPYFPLVKDPNDFAAELEKQLTRLAAKKPKVAAAFERHQPFQPGKTALGYLKPLRMVNAHQDFTAQTRSERRVVRRHSRSLTTEEDNRGNLFIRPGAGGGTNVIVNPETLREPAYEERITFVDWLFKDLRIPVLATLEELSRLIRDAIEDIDREARL